MATGATLALLAALPAAPLVKSFAVIWVGCAGLDAYRAVARRVGPRGVRSFTLVERAIEVESQEGELRDGAFVSPWLTIVRWRPRGALLDRTIVILPDMLDAETFRALRVALRN